MWGTANCSHKRKFLLAKTSRNRSMTIQSLLFIPRTIKKR